MTDNLFTLIFRDMFTMTDNRKRMLLLTLITFACVC